MSPTRAIRPGSIVRGPTLPEPVEVLAVVPLGQSLKIIGRGLHTGLTHDPVLSPDQLARLTVSADCEPFDGHARLFRLGVEAHRLGLAYEYDPFFSLSIARVDPLPHQLEAVYDYFLRLPRIRFLLADDPGAGKTIMAGLLLKELKARGLIRRTLIVTPANRLGREYGKIAFDKAVIPTDPTLEWVTPGHPLFEAIPTDILARVDDHLRRGAVFFDLHRERPAVLDVFAASIKDGRGNTLHRRLFVVETSATGEMALHEPTILHDITPAPTGTPPSTRVLTHPARQQVEQFLYERALKPWADRSSETRVHEVERVERHVEISLNALIDRQQVQLGDFLNRQIAGQTVAGLDGLIAQAEQHLDELNTRREVRQRELELERHCSIADITHIGRAQVLPHPERTSPQLAPMVRDDEIERIAIAEATRYDEARGWVVESVESENRGFDLISRRPHPEDPKTFIEVRFIEVKGRAGVGVVALSENEYRTAQRLKGDYWLYTVFNCGGTPELHPIQNPARLGWKPVMTVEHYQLGAEQIIAGERGV